MQTTPTSPDSRRVDAPSLAVDAHYIALTRPMNNATTIAGATLMLLTILSAADDGERVLFLVLFQLPVMALNIAITFVALPRFGVMPSELARLVMNVGWVVVVSHVAAWPLSVWLIQPLIALFCADVGPRLAVYLLIGYALGQGGIALIDGQPLAYPVGASALAIVTAIASRRRSATILVMLRESERQREELAAATGTTRATLARLEQASEMRAATEVELRQAHKLEAVGRLAAGIAHEINTPVQFIGDSMRFVKDGIGDLLALIDEYRAAPERAAAGVAWSELSVQSIAAEEDHDLAYLSEHVPAALARTLGGLERVATIVRAMKQFSHPDGPIMLPSDLERALTNTLTIAHAEYAEVADIDLDLAGLPPVVCHIGEINQVILHLVVNAAHAIAERPPGGPRGHIRVSTRRDGDDVEIDVADDGVGIAPGNCEHVFEPFFTTKPVGRGTGLGLSLARAIVGKHQGRIGFTSAVGVGTTFTLRLPTLARVA